MQTKTSGIVPLTQSLLNLMGCPYLYQKRVIDGLEEVDNPFAIRGREFHDIRADYVAHLVATRQRKDPAKLDALLNDNAVSEDAFQLLQASRDDFEIDPESVLNIEQRLYLNDDFGPMSQEEVDSIAGFEERNGPSGRGAAYAGKPDLVLLDGVGAIIPDYKTTFNMYDADTPQGRLYALLVMLHYGFVERVVFELHFVRYGNSKRTAEYTRSQISHLKGRVARDRDRQLSIHAMADQGEIAPAIPGEACANCPLLLTSCPERAKNDRAQWTPEDLLQEEVFLRARAKRVESLLKEHVAFHGPVKYKDANGRTYAREFQLKERTFFPALATLQAVTTWIKQGGDDFTAKADGSERLRIGATELKPILKAKKRAPLAESIEGVKIVEKYTQFTLTGVDEEEKE